MKMNAHKLVLKHKRKVSAMLLTVMLSELLLPLRALALTSGPSQPEFQGFTPLATTSLVDPFSGDFSYNIPLLDIEGYPLNLVYRATSNIEEEGSWVGYGWNINVGTLNRMVRGLPDDMNGEQIKSYQNIRDRTVKSVGVTVEPSFGINAGVSEGLGLSAGVQAQVGFTKDDDNYTGVAVGVSAGAGVYAGINAGPFSVGANAGVTLSASSTSGGSMSPYAGFNAGLSHGDYFSVGFGTSVSRTFNTISGWGKPNVMGSFNIASITRETQRNFINSISNDIPQFTAPYNYSSYGEAYKFKVAVALGLLDNLGLDLGIGVTVTNNSAKTMYDRTIVRKGYGYMYSEAASPTDILDFTRDNDGGLNKDLPFLPPAMKTYDVFSSTAHNASNVFRADRNDFGAVRDPKVFFDNTQMENKTHDILIKGSISLTGICLEIKYHNILTATHGSVISGGCVDDMVTYRQPSGGKDQNLFFKACGSPSMADDDYINQVNNYGMYTLNMSNKIKGSSDKKRQVTPEPVSVYTNDAINVYPQTVIPKQLRTYTKNNFPTNQAAFNDGPRAEATKIGAILNTNRAGQTYVYATPVNNNIKNEVAFRANGFNGSYQPSDGLMSFTGASAPEFNGVLRDKLYKNTLTPGYATSYLLNAVLSPDYVDVQNDGITDDDLGTFVKFNYTKTEEDYRWRVPYGDKGQNVALLNQGVKVTKFDDMGSYVMGSKQVWYAHSIESKNYVAEFYLSNREDALDSRSKVMPTDHPDAVHAFKYDKDSFGRMQRLDSIKYYSKHDRYLNNTNAVPLKTIYFDYDYGISSNLPNSSNSGGKLRLMKVRVKHGNEPVEFAETYNLAYADYNPAYSLGNKDGWGNYAKNNRSLPLCEFPYINQESHRDTLNRHASAYHLNSIGLPSGGKIDVEYEADDYTYVQDKRAMALTEVAGVGPTANLVPTDVFGLYDPGRNPYLYIYVKKPDGLSGDYKSFLLNGSGLMYFSFNINIAGNAFTTYDQVKGYAEVEDISVCPNESNYLYIKVKPVSLTGTNVKPSPMVNTAINMARAFASDQLYYQEQERSNGLNYNHAARLKKAANQVADAIFGKNSIGELMKDFKAAHKFDKSKSFVKLAMTKPKVGGGSRVSKLTFDDEWNKMTSGEVSSLVGYKYFYKDNNGMSSGVASYEPTLGGEENPMRSGYSYTMSNNPSKYPPYDPVELIKEDPVGESFFPTGSVGYSMVTIESIHKDYARSAQSRLVQEFYTAKDFPFFSSFGNKSVNEIMSKDYPNPGVRDILLSFLGVSNTISSSQNSYEVKQDFLIETNDMHGKQKASYNYRLLPRNGKQELISSTEYFYHTDGNNRLANQVDVIQYQSLGGRKFCVDAERQFPKTNILIQKKTLGVDIDVCSDSREVVTTENRTVKKKGGGLKICLPPRIKPSFTWTNDVHKHVDYYKATTTTKIINRYGILKGVRTYDEGAETIVESKYYDAVTGNPVVQVVKDKYGDNIYSTNIPGYWTKTDLEPSYMEYPLNTGAANLLPEELTFDTVSVWFLANNKLLQSSFTTTEDFFHQGDELFVNAKSTPNSNPQFHRLYVVDVRVKKDHYAEPDPLSMRYGSGHQTGASYKVYVSPYMVNNQGTMEVKPGQKLYNIQSVAKYRSGRRNMLDVSAGNYRSISDPFVITDSVITGHWSDLDSCKGPSFMKPVINAVASRYESVHAVHDGTTSSQNYNPVSSGILNQPYQSATYALFGRRLDPSQSMHQRSNGIINNWYYWLPDRYDSTTEYQPRKAMLTNYNSSAFKTVAKRDNGAMWFAASTVTRSLPSVGPVEEVNAAGIPSAIFVDPTTKKVLHVTANGKFGQSWVETFENLQQIRKYNSVTDFLFSPFQNYMTKSGTSVPNYHVYEPSQNHSNSAFKGNFTLDKTQSHSGLFSLLVSSQVEIKCVPKTHGDKSYPNFFDFNLAGATSQKYTCEVWVKGSNIPSVVSNGNTTTLAKVAGPIDGWILYRANVNVVNNNTVTFLFPSGSYDDLRVYPSTANVKAYVYHPFKTYLMAVLDENNFATFYEYNNRNQLVRLKKETEKGVLTITENIKNTVAR